MKRTIQILISVAVVLMFASGCESFINDVEPMKDYAEQDRLNTEQNVDFLRLGVLSQFADVSSQTACLGDLLSDQLLFTNQMPLATYPQYQEIELGDILLDNTSVSNFFQDINRYRRVSDDLVKLAGQINFSDTTIRESAYFTGYFHGGLARFYYATIFAINQTTPGGVIDGGPFLSQATMLDQSISMLQSSLLHTQDPAERRMVNSIIARVYLARADYANAANYAAIGMVEGDDPFECLYNDVSGNFYYNNAGAGRQQMGVNRRFLGYIQQDPNEGARIAIDSLRGRDGQYYLWQTQYLVAGSSFPVMTWQENNLMLAECALRGAGAANAQSLVNANRASHGIAALGSVDLAAVMVERDKELFCRGARLIDQNRGAIPWHLGAGTWHYLPVPQDERDANPNLPAY